MINERRAELKNPNFNKKDDFLTILLTDELFSNDDQMMVDECITFLMAATQTTTLLISNALYFLTCNKDKLDTFRNELKMQNKCISDFSKLPNEQWKSILAIENLNDLSYLHNVISETLRLQPSVDASSGIALTEETKLGDYTFRTDSILLVNIYQLHHNEKEWQQHDKFIPERFDPSSEFYLTPSGKKRHPMSYGPFLGGKRICLGKTFAENIGKCVLPIILMQLDFNFVDKDLYVRKPGNSLFKEEAPYHAHVRKYQN